eukprot:g9968.t1
MSKVDLFSYSPDPSVMKYRRVGDIGHVPRGVCAVVSVTPTDTCGIEADGVLRVMVVGDNALSDSHEEGNCVIVTLGLDEESGLLQVVSSEVTSCPTSGHVVSSDVTSCPTSVDAPDSLSLTRI